MNVEFKGKELELKYTFNSFRYMEDFDLSELEELETKPFKMIKVSQSLLSGALNYDPKRFYDDNKVLEILENEVENGDIMQLLENLVELLQNSSFFKNLQQEKPKKKK